MDMLPLVPVVLLGAVGVWLLWPVIVDPLKANLRVDMRGGSESADSLADGLFGAWRDQSEKVDLTDPLRRG